MRDLFTLGDEYANATETSEIFASVNGEVTATLAAEQAPLPELNHAEGTFFVLPLLLIVVILIHDELMSCHGYVQGRELSFQSSLFPCRPVVSCRVVLCCIVLYRALHVAIGLCIL